MAAVRTGRWTVAEDGRDVTVFLIGMRFNRPWRVRHWWPVFVAMPRMLRHLAERPESGLLHVQMWFGRTVLLVQYWESPEHLQRFAAAPDAPHLAPWRDFMRRLVGSGDVGIFHETYRVGRDGREAVYADMPPFGLGRVLGLQRIGPGTSTARQRMRSAPGGAGLESRP